MPMTVGQQRELSKLLGAEKPLVWSDNIRPANVNILPMGLMVDPETVRRCIQASPSLQELGPVLSHAIVLSVLGAATDIGRGSTKHSESQTGGQTPGASSGADHDSASDE